MLCFVIYLYAICSLFQGIFLGYGGLNSIGEYLLATVFFLFFGGIITVISCGVAAGLSFLFSSVPVTGAKHKLSVVRDKDGISGSFALGSGHIESRPYYFYYVEQDDGGLVPSKIEANENVTIYEEDREDAELVEINWMIKFPIWAWLFIINAETSKTTYKFYVPKGSVTPGFSL